jgi:hypothetical protein
VRLAFTLVLLLVPGRAEQLVVYGDPLPARAGPGTLAAEAGAGLAGGLLLGVGALAAASAFVPDPADTASSAAPYGALAAIGAGGSVGAGLGTWLAGSALRQQGRLTGALLGAIAGLPATAGIFYLSTVTRSDPLMVAAALAPPVGAVIGYNLSRPCGCILGSTGRLLPPGIQVDCCRAADGGLSPSARVTLLRIGL